MPRTQLTACELELHTPAEREAVVKALGQSGQPALMVLDTCQRLECFGLHAPELPHVEVVGHWKHAAAFERLARIAAGLESRILGELEVLGQVRDAYCRFKQTNGESDAALDRIFQDALALARKARRDSGIDRQVISLATLAGRELLSRVPEGAPIAVVGSGTLAGSVARYLSKRGKSPIRVAGRCPENAVRLASQLGGFGAGLDQLAPLFDGVSGIVTATAAPHPVVYVHHLEKVARPLTIIDLGTPPDCHTEVAALPALTYVGLRDVEAHAHVNLEDRRRRAAVAAQIIHEGAQAWAHAS